MKTAKGFYFEISDNEKDTMDLLSKLFKKLGIKFQKVNLVIEKQTLDYLEEEKKNDIVALHDDFFSKYVGIFDNKGFVSEADIKEARLKRFEK